MYQEIIHSKTRQANFLRLEGEIAAGRSWLTARPVELALELTTECPMGCIHCFRSGSPGQCKTSGHMDPALFEVLDPFMDTFIRINVVGDGEPLVHPRCMEILERCLKSGAEVSFSTSGDLLGPKRSKRLVEGGIAHIQVSVDAASPRLYARIRRGSRLETVRENLRTLVEVRKRSGMKRPFIVLAAVLMRANIGEAGGLVRLAAECGADQVLFNTLAVPGTSLQAREFFRHQYLTLERLVDAVEGAKETGRSQGVSVVSPYLDLLAGAGAEGRLVWERSFQVVSTYAFPKPCPPRARQASPPPRPARGTGEEREEGEGIEGERVPPIPCTQPWTTFYMKWNGETAGCRQHPETVDRLHPFGDPMTVWNGAALREQRRRLASAEPPERCRPCLASSAGRDVIAEFSQVVLPLESSPEPFPVDAGTLRDEPEADVLGLGFSPWGASAALVRAGQLLIHRTLETRSGLKPSRVISRLTPPQVAGELYLEDALYLEWVRSVIREGGIEDPKRIGHLVYSTGGTATHSLPQGRCHALEERFPEAVPHVLAPHQGLMGLSFFTSPFDEAALLYLNPGGLSDAGMKQDPGGPSNRGEGPAVMLGRGEGSRVTFLDQTHRPGDPGALCRAALAYAGLDPEQGQRFEEMAAAGSKSMIGPFLDAVALEERGGFRFRREGFLGGFHRETPEKRIQILEDRFGPRCPAGSAPASRHLDLVRAVDRVVGDIVVHAARQAVAAVRSRNLCLAGWAGAGRALAGRIERETDFDAVHLPPVPGGSGLAAGNALFGALCLLGAVRPAAAEAAAVIRGGAAGPVPDPAEERFIQAALKVLKGQYSGLIRRAAVKGEGVLPCHATAFELLARQNERLLVRSRWQHQELLRLQDEIRRLTRRRRKG